MFDKKVLVAGAGKSGICASEQLLRNGEQVVLFDENPKGTLTETVILEKLGFDKKPEALLTRSTHRAEAKVTSMPRVVLWSKVWTMLQCVFHAAVLQYRVMRSSVTSRVDVEYPFIVPIA